MAKDIYVGIDLGTLEHRVCVLEDQASRGKELALPQTADDLAAFAARLLAQAQGEPTQVQIAVEAPNGPLVAFLVERGFRVLSINPKQADRFRDRHSLAGAKDDRRDAYVLAASARTDGHLFRELNPADPDLIELREATRTEQELKGSAQARNEPAARAVAALLPRRPGLVAGRRRRLVLDLACSPPGRHPSFPVPRSARSTARPGTTDPANRRGGVRPYAFPSGSASEAGSSTISSGGDGRPDPPWCLLPCLLVAAVWDTI